MPAGRLQISTSSTHDGGPIQAIGYINGHDRPLGLYYFGSDKAEQEKVYGFQYFKKA